MNFYILSHSINEYDKEEYMELSIKCCIGCIPAYPYGEYVHFKNINDTPNENHNHLY